MSDIINSVYIKNSEILKVSDFDEKIINNGKSLYEVIRVIDGIPLFLEEHLERLNNSSKITNKKIWISLDDIKSKLLKLIKVNQVEVGNIKLIFNFGDDDKNTFLAYFIKHHYPVAKDYEEGVKTILYHGERDNPNAKVINSNFREKVNEKIKDCNVYEAILVDRNGNITEGSRSNIFMIKGDTVITSPLVDVLPGVTRDVIINICRQIKLNVEEKRVNYCELYNMDAAFISGTSPKVLPINSIDKKYSYNCNNNNLIKIITNYDKAIKKNIEENK